MTGSDLIVLAPWAVFAAGLAAVCVLLARSTLATGPRPFRCRRSRRHHDPLEPRCPENSEPASPR